MAWGSLGHSNHGGRTYNPDSAGWDYTPTRTDSEGNEQSPSFFTDTGKPVYTNQAPVLTNGAGATGVAPSAGKPVSTGPGAAGAETGKAAGPGVVEGDLKPVMKPTITQLKLGGDWWVSNPRWSDADEWEGRYAEVGELLGGAAVLGADIGYNARRGVQYLMDNVLPMGIPSAVREPQPEYSPDGWVSYDEGTSWEPQGNSSTWKPAKVVVDLSP